MVKSFRKISAWFPYNLEQLTRFSKWGLLDERGEGIARQTPIFEGSVHPIFLVDVQEDVEDPWAEDESSSSEDEEPVAAPGASGSQAPWAPAQAVQSSTAPAPEPNRDALQNPWTAMVEQSTAAPSAPGTPQVAPPGLQHQPAAPAGPQDHDPWHEAAQQQRSASPPASASAQWASSSPASPAPKEPRQKPAWDKRQDGWGKGENGPPGVWKDYQSNQKRDS